MAVKVFPKRPAIVPISRSTPRAGDLALLRARTDSTMTVQRTQSNGHSLGTKVAGAARIKGGVA